MWTQSEDGHQATHNGNNTTIASQAIKRCDAFDEEGGEIKLIIPLIKEVGKLIFFALNTNCLFSVRSNIPFYVYFHVIAIA